MIWAASAFEYVVGLVVSDRRWRFVRREWPDLLIVVLPFLGPLRIIRSARGLRLFRATRLLAVLGEVSKQGRRLAVRHKLHYAMLVTGIVAVGAAALVLAVESEGRGSIHTSGDASWWAVATVTTGGYGDTIPSSPARRGIAAFLMVAGIALFGVLTAYVAASFVEREQGDELTARLDEVLQRLDRIEQRLDGS